MARFKKGDVPHNKGKQLEDYVSPEMIEKMKESHFVTGEGGEKSHSWKGGVQKSGNDATYVWIAPNERARRPVITYETIHGKMPSGWIIYHLDGDKDNDDIENLIAVPRAILLALNNNRLDNKYWTIIKAIEDYLKIKL